jgi:hypothetical protein
MAPFVIREARLTQRRQQFARVTAALLGFAVFHGSPAWAQSASQDVSGSLSATAPKPWLQQKFQGSALTYATYVGTGSFYTSGYSDPYVASVAFIRPAFQIGTKRELSLNARILLELEHTQPGTPNGRRFHADDTWLFLSAKNLYTAPSALVKIGGAARVILPTSYESQYSHLVAGVGVGGNLSRVFEFGAPDSQGKRWMVVAVLGSVFTKNLHTSQVRGEFPGDTRDCRPTGPVGGIGTTSDGDRCGGPLNTSYSFMSSGGVDLSRGRLSLNVSLIVINQFKYDVDPNIWFGAMSDPNTVPRGRNDFTWGIVSLTYKPADHLGVSLGIASYQPALDSRQNNLRFPFYDFSGGANANNFTQFYLGLTGTL